MSNWNFLLIRCVRSRFVVFYSILSYPPFPFSTKLRLQLKISPSQPSQNEEKFPVYSLFVAGAQSQRPHKQHLTLITKPFSSRTRFFRQRRNARKTFSSSPLPFASYKSYTGAQYTIIRLKPISAHMNFISVHWRTCCLVIYSPAFCRHITMNKRCCGDNGMKRLNGAFIIYSFWNYVHRLLMTFTGMCKAWGKIFRCHSRSSHPSKTPRNRL